MKKFSTNDFWIKLAKKSKKKDFKERLKIKPEKINSNSNVCSIGKSEVDDKWYGWSHRAYHGWGIGDPIYLPEKEVDKMIKKKHKDVEISLSCDKYVKLYDEIQQNNPKIKTDKEAKESAINFAKSVASNGRVKKYKRGEKMEAYASNNFWKEAKKDWIPKDLKKGRFTEWCKRHGYDGPCKAAAEQALKSDDPSVRGMGSFYLSSQKFKHKKSK